MIDRTDSVIDRYNKIISNKHEMITLDSKQIIGLRKFPQESLIKII